MRLIKSRLFCTTLLTAFAVSAINPALAGTGTITYAVDYLSQFGGSGNTDGLFSFPEQMVIGPDNNLYIADRNNARIQIFNQNGGYVGQFGTSGSGPGQFNNSVGLAFLPNGNLVATDVFNSRVQIFNGTTKTYVGQFGSQGNGLGQFDLAHHMATDSNGNVYVVDYANDRVAVFDQNGVPVTSIIQTGSSPIGIAIDSNNRIYIACEASSEILIYDSSYNFVGRLAQFGTGPGQVAAPSGLAIDNRNNVYVSDSSNNRIQVFSSNGTFLFAYDNNAQFDRTRGIVVGSDGKIFVGEGNRNVVDILQLTSTETFAAAPTGGNETATTPLANLVLNGTGGSYGSNFIGYNNLLVDGGGWTLNGNNSFAGNVILNNGLLTNNGTLQALSLSVQNGTTLAGAGTFNTGLLVSGIVSPGTNGGNNIGTMNVGNYAGNAQATYRVDVNAAGQSDRIVSSDYINLNNTALDIRAANGTYAFNTNYTIMTATNAITGTFGPITSNFAFLDPVVDYSNPNAVVLSLTRNDIAPPAGGLDFTPFAQTGNQQATAVALTDYSASQFGGNSAIYNQVLGFNQTEANQLLTQISPDEVAATPQIQRSLVQNMQAPLFSRMSNVAAAQEKQSFALFSYVPSSALRPDQMWVETLGGFASQDSNTNAAGYRLGVTGMRGGIDKRVSAQTIVGISVAYANASADFKNSNDKSSTQYGHADIYAHHALENTPLVIEGVVGAGGGRVDTSRVITAGGLGLFAQGNTNAYDITAALKVSAPVAISQTSRVIPSIGTTINWQRQNAMTEKGASPFNLQMNRMTSMPVTITPMLNWQKTIDTDRYNITPDLGAGVSWQMNELDNTINAGFANSTGIPGFTVKGIKQQPLSLNLTAAITMMPYTENTYVPSLTAQATAQINNVQTAGTASLTLKWDL